jgi:hypothetical protein
VRKLILNESNKKQCRKCLLWLEVSNFWKDRRSTLGYQVYCKECSKQYKKSITTPLQKKAHDLWGKYKIRLHTYKALLENQNYKCKLCEKDLDMGNSYKVHLDHCHKTNEIRGILCNSCNLFLGLGEDSIEKFEKAINYLKSARMK